jgi:hypothetical protein
MPSLTSHIAFSIIEDRASVHWGLGHDGGRLAAAGHVSRRAMSRARSCPLALSDADVGFIGIR